MSQPFYLLSHLGALYAIFIFNEYSNDPNQALHYCAQQCISCLVFYAGHVSFFFLPLTMGIVATLHFFQF